jgi:hypothetical protein
VHHGDRLIVLMWHNVEGTWCYPAAPGAGTRGLAQQLRRLKQLASVVPLEDALEALAAGRPLPSRAVAITFDDGYRDNLDLAAPLLQDLGLPATFFLVPGLLSYEVRPWWEIVVRGLPWRGRRSSTGTGGRCRPGGAADGVPSSGWPSA